jgi:deoxyribonuclease IV
MRTGLHVRVGAGYDAAIAYAQRTGCAALQFFSGNPRSYRVGAIDRAALDAFAAARARAGIAPAVIHTSYLINLASEDERTAANSLRLLKNDLAIAAAGGIDFVNTHLGSYGKRDRSHGFADVVRALESALAEIRPGVTLVLENSAGAGALCGGTIEELGSILRIVDHPQLGVCLDTAHSWAAGYEINSKDGVDRFIELAERQISLERLKMFHFNDTLVPLGEHRDRHWHIGEGLIGLEGFRAFAAHPELREKPAILETPGEEEDDMRNMRTIRLILDGVAA